MKTFSEQLLAARKASGLTQEQLAEQMNVSRPMISHWETGRTMPDLDTIKRLSQLLGYNFMQDETPKPPIEEKVSASNEDKESHKKRKWGYLYAFLSGVAVTIAVMYLVVLPKPSQENPDQMPTPAQLITSTPSTQTSETTKHLGALYVANDPPLVEIDPIEYYQQPNERVEGQAYLALSIDENPLRAVPAEQHNSGMVGWHYNCNIQEENGIAFTVTEYSEAFFFEDTGSYIYRFDADRITSWWGSNTIPDSANDRAAPPSRWMSGIDLESASC